MVVIRVDEASSSAEGREEGVLHGEIAPGRSLQVEGAVAVAEGDMVARAPAGVLEMRARDEGAPVHLRRDLRDHDPGMDTVGADEDRHAFPGRLPAGIDRDHAEDERGEEIKERDCRHRCESLESDPERPLHESEPSA
jgi:hypothetical protein